MCSRSLEDRLLDRSDDDFGLFERRPDRELDFDVDIANDGSGIAVQQKTLAVERGELEGFLSTECDLTGVHILRSNAFLAQGVPVSCLER